MGTMSLPPGFRFHPTDDELVGYYLKRRVDNLKIELEVIPVIDLYKCEPWELPEKSFLPKRDLEWFFFVPRDRKYPNGSRTNRATSTGYWKATGKDRKVSCDGGAVCGVRKTLVFYRGRAPGGERTDWVMHEYRLCQDLHHGASNFIGAYALCRVIKRTEVGLLHGEPAPAASAKAARGSGGGGGGGGGHHQQMMSKVSSSSSLVTADHQLISSSSRSNTESFTPSRPRLDILGAAGAESWCDMTTPLYPPPPMTSAPPQDNAFFIGDGIGFPGGAVEPLPHMSFFGDMISDHELLRWDDLPPACANTFSTTAAAAATPTTGAELWNPLPNAPAPAPAPAPLLCRQASDGVVDDLTAWFLADENMVVF